jgi:hypothetical protein
MSTNEDPMTRHMLRPDVIDRLVEMTNGSFRLPAHLSGNRMEIDRSIQAG